MAVRHDSAHPRARKILLWKLIGAAYTSVAFAAASIQARAQTPTPQVNSTNLIPSVPTFNPINATLEPNFMLEPNGQPGAMLIELTADNGGANTVAQFQVAAGQPYTCSADFRFEYGPSQYFGLSVPASIGYANGAGVLSNGQTLKSWPVGVPTNFELRQRPAGWVNVSFTFVPKASVLIPLQVSSPYNGTAFVINNMMCEQTTHPSQPILSATAPKTAPDGDIMPAAMENNLGAFAVAFDDGGTGLDPIQQNAKGLDGKTSAWSLWQYPAYLISPPVTVVNSSATAWAPYYAVAYIAKKPAGYTSYPAVCIVVTGLSGMAPGYSMPSWRSCTQVNEVTGAAYSSNQKNEFAVYDADHFWKVSAAIDIPPSATATLDAEIHVWGAVVGIYPSPGDLNGDGETTTAPPVVATTIGIGPGQTP